MTKPDKPDGHARPSKSPPVPEAWLNTAEAARHLGMRPKSLANMRSLGTGPSFHKLGGKVWYRGDDLITYRARRKYIASGVRDED